MIVLFQERLFRVLVYTKTERNNGSSKLNAIQTSRINVNLLNCKLSMKVTKKYSQAVYCRNLHSSAFSTIHNFFVNVICISLYTCI